MSKKLPVVAIWHQEQSEFDYDHCTVWLSFARVEAGEKSDDCGLGKIVWPDDLDRPDYRLDGLRLTAYGSKFSTFIGAGLDYSGVNCIDEQQASAMVKTLRATNKRLADFIRAEGYAPDFAAWASRTMRALGVTALLQPPGPHAPIRGYWSSGHRYRVLTPGAAVDFIRGEETSWCEKHAGR